ncbi:hypothetical protein CCUS01_07686 [Colletotrichum cuscutae]|uniref:Uncharacterized protein n=1 Tax=Colletotrichum cuscutae TaxID=1209917 RepID=A0AAI9UYF8_9PEZI|nr:hypothetical protein CCUS01_07686 [Colletotrichum cuscutae]
MLRPTPHRMWYRRLADGDVPDEEGGLAEAACINEESVPYNDQKKRRMRMRRRKKRKTDCAGLIWEYVPSLVEMRFLADQRPWGNITLDGTGCSSHRLACIIGRSRTTITERYQGTSDAGSGSPCSPRRRLPQIYQGGLGGRGEKLVPCLWLIWSKASPHELIMRNVWANWYIRSSYSRITGEGKQDRRFIAQGGVSMSNRRFALGLLDAGWPALPGWYAVWYAVSLQSAEAGRLIRTNTWERNEHSNLPDGSPGSCHGVCTGTPHYAVNGWGSLWAAATASWAIRSQAKRGMATQHAVIAAWSRLGLAGRISFAPHKLEEALHFAADVWNAKGEQEAWDPAASGHRLIILPSHRMRHIQRETLRKRQSSSESCPAYFSHLQASVWTYLLGISAETQLGLVIGARLFTDGHDSSGGGVEALRLFSAHFQAYRVKQTETLCQGMRKDPGPFQRLSYCKTAQRTGLTVFVVYLRRIKQGLKGTEKRSGRSKLQRMQPSNGTICRNSRIYRPNWLTLALFA